MPERASLHATPGNLQAFDPVGGDAAFASGLIFGLLSGEDLPWPSIAARLTTRGDHPNRELVALDPRRG